MNAHAMPGDYQLKHGCPWKGIHWHTYLWQ